ncbi:MAG: cyclodeaminase/cyclohydrolase family protein [Anaerolineae bacterium]|nr:cyclodeaminase/cyclohydrolase family protein [Anaerolineae bacterium]
MTFAEKSLQSFLDQVASAEPAPGGGTVAALSGALGASLVAMVCRLTIGKKGYEAVSAEMQTILPRAEALQRELTDLMQADTDAYARVMEAYGLPKTTEDERAARARAIQAALQHAADVPLRVAECCVQVLELARAVVERGNKNAISDGGVGALMAKAGLRGAVFNVLINLNSISDETFKQDRRARANALQAQAEHLAREIVRVVEQRGWGRGG